MCIPVIQYVSDMLFTIGQSCNVLFLKSYRNIQNRSYPHGFRLICTVFDFIQETVEMQKKWVSVIRLLVNYTYIYRIVSTYV